MPPLHLAVRLRLPYDNLRQVFSDWALRSQRLVVYEHPEEDNIHCHALLLNVGVSENTLRNDIKKHGLPLKGAGQLSFKTTYKTPDKQVVDITDESAPQFITYMSKGKYDPKYVKGYDDEFMVSRRSIWVDYKKRSSDETLYLQYVAEVLKLSKEHGYKDGIKDAGSLKVIAIEICKKKYGVINLGCRRDIKMCLDTYMYEADLIKGKDLKLPFE